MMNSFPKEIVTPVNSNGRFYHFADMIASLFLRHGVVGTERRGRSRAFWAVADRRSMWASEGG